MSTKYVLGLVLALGLAVVLNGEKADAVTFSIDGLSPEFAVGVPGAVPPGGLLPGDLFTPVASYGGPIVLPVLPPAVLQFPLPGEVNALSFGRSPASFNTNDPAFFSLDRGSSGAVGTASANEFNFGGGIASEQSSDLFRSNYNGTNSIFADGDGVVQPGNPNPAAFPLGTAEAATFPFPPAPIPPAAQADLDAMDLRFSITGAPVTGRVFFSLDNLSAPGQGFTADDVIIDPSGFGAGPLTLYASGVLLGLIPGPNDIDALVVYDNGDNVYQQGIDIVLFSLSSNSAHVGQIDPISGLAITEGDILIDGASAQTLLGSVSPNAAILHTAESLGLRTTRGGFGINDNLNALDVPEPGVCVVMSTLILTGVRRRVC